MNIERIAWLVTIVIGLVAAALFFHNGFQGYGTLAVLLSLAASVNLAPSKDE
jgi:disulfide bond formation protein DsbB